MTLRLIIPPLPTFRGTVLFLALLPMWGCQATGYENEALGQRESLLSYEDMGPFKEVPRPMVLQEAPPALVGSSTRQETGVLQLFSAGQQTAVAQTTAGLLVFQRDSATWFAHGFGPRWLYSATGLPDGNILISGEEGIVVSEKEWMGGSPLEGLLGDSPAQHLTWTEQGLFFLVDGELHRWQEGTLMKLTWDAPASHWHRLTVGPCMDSGPGLILVGEITSCLDLASQDLQLYTLFPFAIQNDGWTSEGGYMVIQGELFHKSHSGTWTHLELPERVHELFSNLDHPSLWVQGESSWWQIYGSTLTPIQGIAPLFKASFMSVSGELEGIQSGAWVTYTGGNTLQLDGLAPGETVYEARNVSASIDGTQESVVWKFSLDETEVPADGSTWFLDPLELAEGLHTLSITASFEGEIPPVSTLLTFTVKPIPTWSNEIEPIYQEKCSLCHEPGVTTFPLHTIQTWKYNFAEILQVLEGDIMPLLPILPLEDEDKEKVEKWVEFGFLP